jgi:hypothetical protein
VYQAVDRPLGEFPDAEGTHVGVNDPEAGLEPTVRTENPASVSARA